jgi:hypothetical protein
VNLETWKAQAPARAQELEAEVNAFRAGLLRDVGLNPTATKVGLIEAAVTTFTSIRVVRTKLLHSRKSDVATMTERVSWLGSNLARLLRLLNLDAKPLPRSLNDVLPAPKPAPTFAIAPTNAASPDESEEELSENLVTAAESEGKPV